MVCLRAIGIIEKDHGEDHVQIASVLRNLAGSLQAEVIAHDFLQHVSMFRSTCGWHQSIPCLRYRT